MSDAISTNGSLDPERPWIVDERELPNRMNWLDTLFNPFGKSPKLHFTRAWTLLFFMQFLIVVIPVFGGFVFGLTGGDGSLITTPGLYISPVVFVATTVLSYVIHTRRLRDARKPTILAAVLIIPLLLGVGMFAGGVMSKAGEYQQMYEKRAEYLADPQAWEQARLEERRKAQEEQRKAREAAAAAEAEDGEAQPQGQQRGRGQGRGGWGGGPDASQELPSQIDFILKPNLGSVQMAIIPISALIMLWSLFWLARKPTYEEPYERLSS